MEILKKINPLALVVAVSLLALDGYIWFSILSGGITRGCMYLLNSGRGESVLTVFSDGTEVMTDAGRDKIVTNVLQHILPRGDHYLDLAIVSVREPDAFGGYLNLLDHYQVGAFIYNGREDKNFTQEWSALTDKITAKHIPLITLGAGDHIRVGDDEIDILSPDTSFLQSVNGDEATITELVKTGGFSALLAGGASAALEESLIALRTGIKADVLQVPVSPSPAFLRAVNPRAAVSMPAVNGALMQFASSTDARLFRINGGELVAISFGKGSLRVTTLKGVVE